MQHSIDPASRAPQTTGKSSSSVPHVCSGYQGVTRARARCHPPQVAALLTKILQSYISRAANPHHHPPSSTSTTTNSKSKSMKIGIKTYTYVVNKMITDAWRRDLSACSPSKRTTPTNHHQSRYMLLRSDSPKRNQPTDRSSSRQTTQKKGRPTLTDHKKIRVQFVARAWRNSTR